MDFAEFLAAVDELLPFVSSRAAAAEGEVADSNTERSTNQTLGGVGNWTGLKDGSPPSTRYFFLNFLAIFSATLLATYSFSAVAPILTNLSLIFQIMPLFGDVISNR